MDDSKLQFFSTKAKANLGFLTSSTNDFHQENFEYIDEETAKNISPIPYCIDFNDMSLIFATGIDRIAAAHSTFHYIFLNDCKLKFTSAYN